MEFEWVESSSRQAELLDRWLQRAVIAIDTEFMRVDTFYPIPGLVQVADGDGQALLDPLAIKDLSSLGSLLDNGGIVKVLHSCYEDLEVLHQLTGVPMVALFDTQLAASYLGYGLQIGYQRLLQAELAVEIPKDEARSDWLKRPLSQTQLQYAAQDVHYLLPLKESLEARLRASGHWERVLEDNALLIAEMPPLPDPDEVWRDVANAWRLRPQELAVLQALCRWREITARERNLPRNFLIRSNSLFDLARVQPGNMAALASIEGMVPKILRKEGEGILAVIAAAKRIPKDDWPTLLPLPWPKEIKKVLNDLRVQIESMADRLQLPAEVMFRKKHLDELLECFVNEQALPLRFQGWRGEEITPALIACLEAHAVTLREWQQQRERS